MDIAKKSYDFSTEGLQADTAIGLDVVEDEPSFTNRTKASVEVLLEFLEIAIHQILYARHIYQEESFIKRKKYNIPIYISAHPGLNEYITKSLHSLMTLLQQDRISQICVLLKNDQTPLEKYVFEVKMNQAGDKNVEDLIKMEQSLRAFIIKILSNSSITSSRESQELNFEILIGCAADCEAELNTTDLVAMKWVTLDAADVQGSFKAKKLIPVKAVTNSSMFNMQLIIEEIS